MSTRPGWLPEIMRALEATFPEVEFRGAPLLVDSGFRSFVVEYPEGIIWRVGRVPDAAAGYEREIALLPAIADRLHVEIPDIKWHASPCDSFPNGVAGYIKIEGRPLSRLDADAPDGDQLARDIAVFLRAMDRIPSSPLESRGVPVSVPERRRLAALRAEVAPVLERQLDAAEKQRLTAWWEEVLADEPLDRFSPALTHGDFWHENLLTVSGRELTGVVDWESAVIGDRARDLATLSHLSDSFREAVMVSYAEAGGDVSEEMKHRVNRHRESRELNGIAYSILNKDEEELQESIDKFRSGPVFD